MKSNLLVFLTAFAALSSAFACPENSCTSTDQGRYANECIQAFTVNGYRMDYGNRISLCATRANSATGISALKVATGSNVGLSDDNVATLLQYTNNNSVACLSSLVQNGYKLNYGGRISICNFQGNNPVGIDALNLLTSTSIGISDTELSAVLSYRYRESKAAMQILINNGYRLDYGSRLSILGNFCTQTALNALSAVAGAGKGISDDELSTISMIK